MKDSAAYPRKFAKKIYKEHTASMEDPWYLDYDGLCLSSLPCQPIPELWIKLESSQLILYGRNLKENHRIELSPLSVPTRKHPVQPSASHPVAQEATSSGACTPGPAVDDTQKQLKATSVKGCDLQWHQLKKLFNQDSISGECLSISGLSTESIGVLAFASITKQY